MVMTNAQIEPLITMSNGSHGRVLLLVVTKDRGTPAT